MKKRFFCLLLCLLMMASLTIPASAAYEYGKYYDETNVLWTAEAQTLGEETLVVLADAYDFDIRVDVFTSLGGDGIVATAEYVFDKYYGADTNGNGVSLSIYVVEDATGWRVENWYVHVNGDAPAWKNVDDTLYEVLSDGFAFAAWEGDVNSDCQAITQVLRLMAAGVAQYANENGINGGSAANTPAVTAAPEADNSPIVPAATVDFGTEGNVIDLVGVITQNQDAALEGLISSIANPYQCGCYIVVTDNYMQFGDTAPDAVINLYHGNDLGLGDTRDGILLMLDPVNRKFAFFVYGENAEYIFDAYGQEQLEQVFLDDFGNDKWYCGLEDFAVECGEYMELAAQGVPVRQNKSGYYAVAVLAGLLVSAIVCFVLVKQMKSVYTGSEALEYVTAGGLQLTQRSDIFMYKTTTTRDLSDDNDSSSSTSSFSGGGGSGRSGSF